MKKIGTFKYNINVANSYQELATSDEAAAKLLLKHGEYRQSCYFTLQSMGKLIRAKIFTLVDAKNDYFRNENRSHSVEDAINFLVKVISADEIIKEQVKQQVTKYVLGDVKSNHLHNNLRYPIYFQRSNYYALLDITKSDAEILLERMELLKKFIVNIDSIS